MPSRRQIMLSVAACACGGLIGCGNSDVKIEGKWVADQSSWAVLYFYPDGTASISGTGYFNLQWKAVGPQLVKIDILDKKVVFHFRISSDSKGPYGALELLGFETLTFRKSI